MNPISNNMHRNLPAANHRNQFFRRPAADEPRGPEGARRALVWTGLGLGSGYLSFIGAGAVTVALVSNPVGWGFGIAAIVLGSLGLPLAAVIGATPPPPAPAPADAAQLLLDWLEARTIVLGGAVVRRTSIEQLEDGFRLRAEPDFQWMTMDMLIRVAHALSAFAVRAGDYANQPDLLAVLGHALQQEM